MTTLTVGFTGTREGITPAQDVALWQRLSELRGTDFHHGDCKGADVAAAKMAREIGYRVIAHPPDSRRMRAFHRSDEIRPELPYLERNRNIVDAAGVLLACPDGPERLRSGTWSTVRYARRQGVTVVVILPDGSTG